MMTLHEQIKALLELGIEMDADGVTYNAIIPVIQKQNSIVLERFCMSWPDGRYLFNATPAQLCEALLRATNKWKD